jgi:L-ascorbate metabolism protein UlaG (beta-lactamase superfamily)
VSSSTASLTYVGGPTAVIEWRGLRLLTDPTFDPGGTTYELPGYSLHKIQSPAIEATAIPHVDAVLLSHDHHPDNLDHAGRALLSSADHVLTTAEGAERLGGNAAGLGFWQETWIAAAGSEPLTVTATPARHGPAGGDRGPVIGFALAFADAPEAVICVSGDTVWFDGVAEVARRFDVRVAVLNTGAARVAVARAIRRSRSPPRGQYKPPAQCRGLRSCRSTSRAGSTSANRLATSSVRSLQPVSPIASSYPSPVDQSSCRSSRRYSDPVVAVPLRGFLAGPRPAPHPDASCGAGSPGVRDIRFGQEGSTPSVFELRNDERTGRPLRTALGSSVAEDGR